MNAMLTPLPVEKDPVQADCVKWFIGYMPVPMGDMGGDVDVRPLPPLPDFSASPSWATAANPFTGGFRTADRESWVMPEEMPNAVEDEGAVYTDEDLHDALADLMVADDDLENEVPMNSGEIAPMLRAAARRAVAEMVDPLMRCDAPMSLGRVCGGIKAIVARWISHRSAGGIAPMWQVIGLQMYCKAPAGLMISTGDIPVIAEDEIAKALENSADSSDDTFYIDANTQVHLLYGKAHVLAAIIRGVPDETMVEDLAYLLRRIEIRMERRPVTDNACGTSIRTLLLEGLLIRAPMAPAVEGHAITV